MKTVLILMGSVGSALLWVDAHLLLANLMRMTADHGFGLIIPFLFTTGTIVATTSRMVAGALFSIATLLFVAKMMEDPSGLMTIVTGVWIVTTAGLCFIPMEQHKSA
ncbi:MAG: hypothetical protein COA52_04590 [Hyphomicrobiales bacterium]|nr:hypothetical protein [Hyphomicrobiales bacterium]PCJ94689.1 MAG: hypothetical protein COA52_04590 [Hyphomicrobiales bacterium]